ncbi:uncharacterized protein LOC132797541 [Drosophila nasuta]|uniref:uncharacterized protein LOC132797541 n=1 Tax=Drosophila nasuta TaxID=42062 RepID=UPI00295EB9A0|nr:uncharacterized protein LOC132797541 [Drosophila nasuta]
MSLGCLQRNEKDWILVVDTGSKTNIKYSTRDIFARRRRRFATATLSLSKTSLLAILPLENKQPIQQNDLGCPIRAFTNGGECLLIVLNRLDSTKLRVPTKQSTFLERFKRIKEAKYTVLC